METITYRMMTWIGLGAASVAIILSVDPKVNLVGYPPTSFVSIVRYEYNKGMDVHIRTSAWGTNSTKRFMWGYLL